MKLKRFKNLIFLNIARYIPMPSRKVRPYFVHLGGVYVADYKTNFIGSGVIFDTNHPENITLERGSRITNGCVILSHYFNVKTRKHNIGNVIIGEGAFIGSNTVICKPVKVGKLAVIGASSVVTKDIPDNQVWAGNPAKFIKQL